MDTMTAPVCFSTEETLTSVPFMFDLSQTHHSCGGLFVQITVLALVDTINRFTKHDEGQQVERGQTTRPEENVILQII